MPKISIIIPTYNRAWALKRSVKSVLQQTEKDFELLVVDDGSTDHTQDLLDTFKDPRITVITTTNHGVSRARNKGIAEARGEWLAFLDSDDEWLPHKLERQWSLVQEKNTLKIVHGEEIWFRRGVRVNPKNIHKKSGGWIFSQCLPLCLISPSAVMIHREVFDQIGNFDPSMIVCEDYDLWLRITPFYEVGFLHDPIIKKYGGHSDQLSTQYKAMDYFRVQSLVKILQMDIGEKNRAQAKKVLAQKAQILIKGYKKHYNQNKHHEMRELLNQYQ